MMRKVEVWAEVSQNHQWPNLASNSALSDSQICALFHKMIASFVT